MSQLFLHNHSHTMSSAPSTAAPAATDEDASGVRRSGRKRKSTIVKIQGHSVLARNNYVLKGGSYVMGAFDADDQANKKKPKTATKKPAGAKANNGPRQPKASEIARMQHNEAVKKSILEKQAARRAFLVRQYDILEPFMDEATRRMVASWRPNATIPNPTNPPTEYATKSLHKKPKPSTKPPRRVCRMESINGAW